MCMNLRQLTNLEKGDLFFLLWSWKNYQILGVLHGIYLQKNYILAYVLHPAFFWEKFSEKKKKILHVECMIEHVIIMENMSVESMQFSFNLHE